MKTLITIITMMVFTIAIGTAYADEFPIMSGKDVGTELYLSAFGAPEAAISKDFSVKGERIVPMEIGTQLYHEAFLVKDAAMETSAARGAAAGGVAKEDENTRIWDTLLSPVGGSDLP